MFPSGQNCIWSKKGSEYMGTIHHTRGGGQCIPWSTQMFHSILKLTDKENKSDNNMCRNPSNRQKESPYCYSHSENNPLGQIDYCSIPRCGKFL